MDKDVQALAAAWFPGPTESTNVVQLGRLASSLRGVLEAVKRKPNLPAPHVFAFKESAAQLHAQLKRLEAEKAAVTYAQLLARPGFTDIVRDFVAKACTLLSCPPPPLPYNAVLSAAVASAAAPAPTPVPSVHAAEPAAAAIDPVQWLRTTCVLPAAPSDPVALAALFKDGALFCHMLNCVFPGAVPTIYRDADRQFKSVQNMQAFLSECRLRLGLNKDDLFDPIEVYSLSGKSVLQVAETLRLFVETVQSRRLPVTRTPFAAAVAPAGAPSAARAAVPMATTAAPVAARVTDAAASVSAAVSVSTAASIAHVQAAPPVLSASDTSFRKAYGSRDLPLSMGAPLPPRFIALSSRDGKRAIKPAAPTPVATSRRAYRMFTPFSDDGTLFRCVDAQTRRVTCQRLECSEIDIPQFEAMLGILRRYSHPFAMRVSSYWYEEGYVYVEMPFYSYCTLREWLQRTSPGEAALRDMLSMIVMGLAFLHQQGIVHHRLSADCIVISTVEHSLQNEVYYPIICGLGYAESSLSAQSHGFRSSGAPRDIWMLGALFFDALTRGAPLRYSSGVPQLLALAGTPAGKTLAAMLHRDPLRRPCAAALCLDPYFSRFSYYTAGALLRDLEAFVGRLAAKWRREDELYAPPLVIEVEEHGATATTQVLDALALLSADDLLRPITFFSDTAPLAGGGGDGRPAAAAHMAHSAAIVRAVWADLVHSGDYFEAMLIDQVVQLVPSRRVRTARTFHSIGLFIVKHLIARMQIPAAIAAVASNALRWYRMGLLSGGALDGSTAFAGLSDTEKALLRAFRAHYTALAEGLLFVGNFGALTPFELHVHACGTDHLTSEHVRAAVQFFDFPVTSATVGLFRDFIDSLTPARLRQFLLFACSQADLRGLLVAPGADNTLAFVEGDLSVKVMNRGGLLRAPARSAWATIELAEYEDPDEFAKAMNEALREVLA